MNNSLMQMLGQLRAIWRQLGVNQRVSLALAGVGVAGVLAGLVWFTSRTDYALLYGKLDSAEASKVLTALDDAKVAYKIGAGGNSIYVPSEKVHYMRMKLAEKGIPRMEGGVGYELFDKANFGISDFVQRANWLRAIQGELGRTISQVDAIESARVMVVIPESRILVDSQRKPTASVFVKTRGNATLPSQTVAAIRFLVANAVEGLQSNFVTVVDNSGNVLSENSEGDPILGLTGTQLSTRKNLEQHLTKKVQEMLATVLGPGDSVVRVAAEINFDTVTRKEEKYDPEGQVIRSSLVRDETQENSTQSAGTAVGVQGNTAGGNQGAPAETNNAAGPSNKVRTLKKDTENKYEINQVTSTLTQNPGAITRLSASISVKMRMTGTGAERKPAPRTPEEMDKLRRLVQGAIGIEQSPTRKDNIVVEEIAFNEEPALEIAGQIQKQERKDLFLEVGRLALYPGLALGMMIFLWRAFKKTPAENIPIGIPLGELGYQGANGNGRSRNGGGGDGENGLVTVDVLNQLIRENPQNVSQAIRGWINKKPGR